MPQHASRVTVYAEWPSEAPSSMTVVAYGVTLREMSRKTVTGVDTVSFFCPERIRAAIAFPYTEEEWRSLRLSSTGSFLAASVSYGEDFKGGTLFCSGGNFVEKEECHIRGRAFLQPREICLLVDHPSRIASIEGTLSGVPAGALLSSGDAVLGKTSVTLSDWKFSGTMVRSSCLLFDGDCVGTVSLRILLSDGKTVFRTCFPSGPPGMFPVPEISLPDVSDSGFFQAEVGDWTQSDTIIINV